MILRFRKVTNGLYRGSAPSPKDVLKLKENLGIKKIISLDEKSGQRINRACKMLRIDHIMLPLDGSKTSLVKLLKHDLYDLLITGGPTFFHCFHGKDRTGLLAALFECKYLGKSPENALSDAKKLGFGVGVDPDFISLYEKLIKACKPVKSDENNADIVSNQRDYRADSRDSYLDEASQSSFAPYLGKQRQYPSDSVYLSINDQSPTRENYNKPIIEHDNNEDNVVPVVGLFNNDAGGRGVGPTENYSGFFYD